MEVREFQDLMRKLYYERDLSRGREKTLLWLLEEVGELSEGIRKGDDNAIEEEIADVIAWTVSLANLYGIDVEGVISEKYPDRCRYCNQMPCACDK
ncbi:MAG: MazG nucleotide pyrophosphohydrolase domain-containing protein [Candidatus Hydrothermarchaeales archaeon]